VDFKTLPAIGDIIRGTASATAVRSLRVEDLLAREPVRLDLGSIRSKFQDKAILITGAGGSIGSELSRQIADFRPSKLVLLDQGSVVAQGPTVDLLSNEQLMLQFDLWFMKHRTNAPYLIGPDSNYYRNPATGKPMMWDPIEKDAKPFNAQFTDIALTGIYRVNDTECRTALDIVREGFVQYTPEWAESICTVPAKTIRRIAKEFVENARIGSTIEIDGFTSRLFEEWAPGQKGINNGVLTADTASRARRI
jgi:hypothetical protein